MAEPSTFSALSSTPGRLQSSRVSTALSHPPRRTALDEPFGLQARRHARPRPAETPEPPATPVDSEAAPREVVEDPSARLRAAEHASAERTLRGALLVSLFLNLVVFLGIGFSLPLESLNRADALLAAVTLIAAVGLLALGELCRKGSPPKRS